MGIEPTFLAWEANVLPFNYTRGINVDLSSMISSLVKITSER